MALDEVLLAQAAEPLLRIYQWREPAVSFGYFGKWAVVATQWPGRELVRRWTGGGVVSHGDDLTYTLVVPRAHPFSQIPALDSYRAIHESLAPLLHSSGESAQVTDWNSEKISDGCFENASRFDVLLGSVKVAGAAQRRTKAGLLHQGSIQSVNLSLSLAGRLPRAFAAESRARELTASEVSSAEHLAASRYATREWLHRW